MNDPSPLLHSEGVTGLCIHTGAEICWKRLPANCSEAQAASLCAAVETSFKSYAAAERRLTEACFSFSLHTVLVIARPPKAEAPAASDFVTFLLTSPAAAAEAAIAARKWLSENPVLKKAVPRPASPLMVRKK